MNDEELCFLPIAALSRLIRDHVLSPCEVVAATLRRIEETEGTLGAYVTVTADMAVEAAAIAEREIGAGNWRGPLHGIPMSLKDIIYVKDVPNTGGSKVLADFVPDHDAAVTERLRAAGAVVIGKTRLWELAMRGEAEPCKTRNPWKPDHAPMGSSSGSAVSVAAGSASASLGTDTGGSIRGPASACGIVGYKPSFGRVSRYGVTPVSWSLDHVGSLTRTVEDCALVMNVIAGFDPRDGGSAITPTVDYTNDLDRAIGGLRLGVPDHLFDLVNSEMVGLVEDAIDFFTARGATRHNVFLPDFEAARTAQTVITLAEAASVHEEAIRARPSDFGETVRARLQLGSLLFATDYLRAQRVRTVFQQRLSGAMADLDILVTPTSPDAPPRLEEAPHYGGAETLRAAANLFRWPFNLTGAPAISVPCGFTSEGLPVGMQIAGKPMQDALVLGAAHAYERGTEWHKAHPPPCRGPRSD